MLRRSRFGFRLRRRSVSSRLLQAIVVVFVVVAFVAMIAYAMAMRHDAPQPPNYEWLTTRNVSHFVRPDDPDTILLTPKEEHLCSGDGKLRLLVIVMSSPANTLARASARTTWVADVNKLPAVSSVFLVGKSSDHDVQASIEEEHSTHHDMVQVDLLDAYTNLTLKSTFLLRWLLEAAPSCAAKAKFVLRVDDDSFVNAARMWDALEHATLHSASTKSMQAYIRSDKDGKPMLDSESVDYLLLGYSHHAVPIRDVASKWYLPSKLYPLNIFPRFLSGSGYVFTASVAHVLYTCALRTPFINLEDVFITGLCANTQLGLKLTHSDQFLPERPRLSGDYECFFRTSALMHPVDPDRMEAVWTRMQHDYSCQTIYFSMLKTANVVVDFIKNILRL